MWLEGLHQRVAPQKHSLNVRPARVMSGRAAMFCPPQVHRVEPTATEVLQCDPFVPFPGGRRGTSPFFFDFADHFDTSTSIWPQPH
jgi:hypothetical protein